MHLNLKGKGKQWIETCHFHLNLLKSSEQFLKAILKQWVRVMLHAWAGVSSIQRGDRKNTALSSEPLLKDRIALVTSDWAEGSIFKGYCTFSIDYFSCMLCLDSWNIQLISSHEDLWLSQLSGCNICILSLRNWDVWKENKE